MSSIEIQYEKNDQLPLLVCAAVLLSHCHVESFAQDFRVESRVYVGDNEVPASENLTLYSGGLAYDFQLATDETHEPIEIVIYDSRQRTFVLLDTVRELRTDIADFELLKMLENLRSAVEQNEDLDFLMNPQFEKTFDIDTGWIALTNNDITYRARGEAPRDLSAMPFFYEAQDQFTRLSASDPKRLPPFARLALNSEIRRQGLFPAEIEVNMRSGTVAKKEFRAHSNHVVVWQLSKQDQRRIDEAKSRWMTYEKVALGEYRQLGVESSSEE